MITKAKVSLASVKSFRQAATEVLDFSPSFNKGIACIEQLLKSLVELENSVKAVSYTHLTLPTIQRV